MCLRAWLTPGALTHDCGHQLMGQYIQIGKISGLEVRFIILPPFSTATWVPNPPPPSTDGQTFIVPRSAGLPVAVQKDPIERSSATPARCSFKKRVTLEDLPVSITTARLFSKFKIQLSPLSRPASLAPLMHLHMPSGPLGPPSPSETTHCYDEAERGGPDPRIEPLTFNPPPHNPPPHTHFYGPIAVTDYFFGQPFTDGPPFLVPQADHGPDPFADQLSDVSTFFGEQIGGGGGPAEAGQPPSDPHTPTPHSRRSLRPVTLTPRAQHVIEAINFARSREAAIADNPPSPPSTSTPSGPAPVEEPLKSQSLADDLAFLEGLAQSDLAHLAHDRSSDFTVSPPLTDGSSDGSASLPGSGPPPPRGTSLLDEFYIAGEFEPLLPQPGRPKEPLPKSTIPISEAILPLPASTPAASTDQGNQTTSATTQTEEPRSTPSKPAQTEPRSTPTPLRSPEGRPSRQDLEDCREVFQEVHGLFEDLAKRLNRPKASIVKWFTSGLKVSRRESAWNLYQAYFARHSGEEQERSGIPDGTGMDFLHAARTPHPFSLDSDCWPSFQELYGDDTDAVLHAARELDCKLTQKETLQQRSRSFQQHSTKLENLIKEGTEQRFHAFAVMVGDCVLEDQGLNCIVASPGLENPKCKPTIVSRVARTVTKSIDAEKIIQELDAIMDSIEADLGQGTPIVAVADSEDEENNVISSCKNRLVSLLKAATEAAGMRWEKDRLPWTTLVQYLVGISHVIDGWPAGAAMPHETTKAKKAEATKSRKGKGKETISQGIKDLSTKDGRLLLTALQDGSLTIRKADQTSIMSDAIAVIKTAPPTHRDDLCVRSRGIYASGKTFVGGGCPKTAATTRVRPKKVVVVDVSSDSSAPPTASVADSSKPSAKKILPTFVDISSDSSPPPPKLPLHGKSTTSLPGSKQPRAPAPPFKRAAPRADASSDEEESSESRKRPRCTSSHIDKDNEGSGDDYPADDQAEPKGRGRRPATRSKGKKAGKERNHDPAKVVAAGPSSTGSYPPPGLGESAGSAPPPPPGLDTTSLPKSSGPSLPQTLAEAPSATSSATSKPADTSPATSNPPDASLPTRSTSSHPSSAPKISHDNRPPNPPRPNRQPPRLNPTSAPQSRPTTSAAKPPTTQPDPKAEKLSEGAKHSTQPGPDPFPSKSPPQAPAPSQHPPAGSSKPAQRPRTGQDIVDSFPPLRRPPPALTGEQGHRGFRSQQRPPSGQPTSTSESMQTNRAAGPLPHRFPDAQGNFDGVHDPNSTPASFEDYPMHDVDSGAYQSYPHRYPNPLHGPPTGYPRSRGRGYPQRHRGAPSQHYGPNSHPMQFNAGYGPRRSASGPGMGPPSSGAYPRPNYWGLQPYDQGEYGPEEGMGEPDDYGYDDDGMLS
ncbi:hypothetical protein H0H93_012072 [Arthromyces matolae]|nr:hypothetical protein H0H93_012072 [Arthromyces matolae]